MTDFAATRALFDLPEGQVYLDGNSLGPLPKAVPDRVARTLRQEWGRMAIGGWNRADWIGLPARVGDRIGRLIGAEPGSVMVGDTLSVQVFQGLAALARMRPERRVILSDSGNFPSDLYIADGLADLMGAGHEVRVVAPEAVADAIDERVAVLLLTEVDYRTGRRHDMPALTAKAHDAGALAVWDLAHSAGAVDVDVAGGGADIAVGCTYKYLNGGPGAPAFVYVAPRLADDVTPALTGWLGHAAPFDFTRDWRPAPGVSRMRIGTPPILSLAALDAALDGWDGVEIADVRARSLALADRFIAQVEARCPEVTLVTPRAHRHRGSQVSFRHPEGYAVMQALIARGVVGDFRAPDILRFGITPLYLDEADMVRAAETLQTVLDAREWDREAYRTKATVT